MTMSSLPGLLWLFLSPSLPDFHPVILCEVPKIVITLSRKCTVFVHVQVSVTEVHVYKTSFFYSIEIFN